MSVTWLWRLTANKRALLQLFLFSYLPTYQPCSSYPPPSTEYVIRLVFSLAFWKKVYKERKEKSKSKYSCSVSGKAEKKLMYFSFPFSGLALLMIFPGGGKWPRASYICIILCLLWSRIFFLVWGWWWSSYGLVLESFSFLTLLTQLSWLVCFWWSSRFLPPLKLFSLLSTDR